MTSWSAITWDAARAGGFLAYILLTLAVAAGLVLRNRWQSTRWPRFVTNELHGYLSLLALGLHHGARGRRTRRPVHSLRARRGPGPARVALPAGVDGPRHSRSLPPSRRLAEFPATRQDRPSHVAEDPCPRLRRLRSGDRAWTRDWKRHTYRLGAESVRNERSTRRCARGPTPARPVRTRRSAAAGTRCRRRARPRRHRRLGGRRALWPPIGGRERAGSSTIPRPRQR